MIYILEKFMQTKTLKLIKDTAVTEIETPH